MRIKGKSIKLGDNINTDSIISGRYKFSITDIKELAKHIMEDTDPNFAKKIIPNESIMVAGENFGMGSSREQAPLVIKESGIVGVIAKSFARIFYRNGFNVGLLLIQTDTDKIVDNDILEIDLRGGVIFNVTKNIKLSIQAFPDFMQKLLQEGGIVNYIKKYKELKL
jgi:3-isopropylmalate/(R)-2-methylmalate dehydratase small subunit